MNFKQHNRKKWFAPQTTQARRCDVPGCAENGEFKAPHSPQALHLHYWFCLEHVREYNAQWDFYAGMSAEEIDAHRRNDITWQRPTWQWRERYHHSRFRYDHLQHAADAFMQGQNNNSESPYFPGFSSEETEAAQYLGLTFPITKEQLKKNYKALVKAHHPDAQGGCKIAEEKLKKINGAYQLLKLNNHIK